MNKVEEYIASISRLATIVKLYHLHTRSLAEHLATSDLYDDLSDKFDEIAENYQGNNSMILSLVVSQAVAPTEIADLISMLKAMCTYYRDGKKDFSAEIQNMIDEMLGSLNKCIYKLTFLK